MKNIVYKIGHFNGIFVEHNQSGDFEIFAKGLG